MLAHYFHALGHACKFVHRCENLYKIGPRTVLTGYVSSRLFKENLKRKHPHGGGASCSSETKVKQEDADSLPPPLCEDDDDFW